MNTTSRKHACKSTNRGHVCETGSKGSSLPYKTRHENGLCVYCGISDECVVYGEQMHAQDCPVTLQRQINALQAIEEKAKRPTPMVIGGGAIGGGSKLEAGKPYSLPGGVAVEFGEGTVVCENHVIPVK